MKAVLALLLLTAGAVAIYGGFTGHFPGNAASGLMEKILPGELPTNIQPTTLVPNNKASEGGPSQTVTTTHTPRGGLLS